MCTFIRYYLKVTFLFGLAPFSLVCQDSHLLGLKFAHSVSSLRIFICILILSFSKICLTIFKLYKHGWGERERGQDTLSYLNFFVKSQNILSKKLSHLTFT